MWLSGALCKAEAKVAGNVALSVALKGQEETGLSQILGACLSPAVSFLPCVPCRDDSADFSLTGVSSGHLLETQQMLAGSVTLCVPSPSPFALSPPVTPH